MIVVEGRTSVMVKSESDWLVVEELAEVVPFNELNVEFDVAVPVAILEAAVVPDGDGENALGGRLSTESEMLDLPVKPETAKLAV